MSKEKQSIKSPISGADSYDKEHAVLMEMYNLYQDSQVVDTLSFSQYFDCLIRLDSARYNHEMHNFFKAEHNMNENFILGAFDEEDEI